MAQVIRPPRKIAASRNPKKGLVPARICLAYVSIVSMMVGFIFMFMSKHAHIRR